MNRLYAILFALAVAVSSIASVSLWRMPSAYRDARCGADIVVTNADRVQVFASLPSGVHEAITVTMWMRFKPETEGSHRVTTYALWCPESIVRSNPDLLTNAGGFASGGIDLTALGGSVTVQDFPFQGYGAEHSAITSRWPRGVYTIAGSSAGEITVTLGGEDVTVGPGAFNRNAIPGPSDDVVISGASNVTVGISRTPCHEFHYEIDGVTDEANVTLTSESIVSNEIAMCSWRIRCDAVAGMIYQSNIGRLGAFDDLSQVKTNGPCSGLSSDGHYEFGLMGLSLPPYEFEVFDARVFAWWLTDEELDRVHLNGVMEIGRRGIPQWR